MRRNNKSYRKPELEDVDKVIKGKAQIRPQAPVPPPSVHRRKEKSSFQLPAIFFLPSLSLKAFAVFGLKMLFYGILWMGVGQIRYKGQTLEERFIAARVENPRFFEFNDTKSVKNSIEAMQKNLKQRQQLLEELEQQENSY